MQVRRAVGSALVSLLLASLAPPVMGQNDGGDEEDKGAHLDVGCYVWNSLPPKVRAQSPRPQNCQTTDVDTPVPTEEEDDSVAGSPSLVDGMEGPFAVYRLWLVMNPPASRWLPYVQP